MSDKVKLTVTMDVTAPQALALQAMFDYWNWCGNVGRTRKIAFYVDGDGDFHPHCNVKTDRKLPELTDEMRRIAIVSDDNGDQVYDYDGIAWILEDAQQNTQR